jgi:hypothetical protein
MKKNMNLALLKPVLLASVLGLSKAAFAESSTETLSSSSSSTSESQLLQNKKFEETNTLTDPALKAADGSLSRYSFKGSLSYSGPSLDNLSAQKQPNPDGTNANYAQRISGSVTANYRLTAVTSISGGTGITDNYPFSGTPTYETNNPFLAYNMADRWGNLQMRNMAEGIYTTAPVYANVGEVGGVEWLNGLVYTFEKSDWGVSLDTTAYYWIFGRGYQASDAKAGTVQQYVLNSKPGLKYNVSDKLVAYSNLVFEWYNPRDKTGNSSAIWHRADGLSAGIGYAHSRDIYISPYITTYPWTGNAAPGTPTVAENQTTINLTTTFSLL